MEQFFVNNYNVFKGEQELFFSLGDDHLFKVAGEHAYLIEVLFQKANLTNDAQELLQLVHQHTLIDKETIELGYNWLKEKGIIQVQQNKEKKHQQVSCLVAGFFNNDLEMLHTFLSKINNDKYALQLTQIVDFSQGHSFLPNEKPELILLFSPFLVAGNVIKEIASYAFNEDVAIVHIGFNSNYMTLGPILDKEKDTPCLSCYYKRKMQNLSSLKEHLSFVDTAAVSKLGTMNVLKNNYSNIAAEFLKIELNNFFEKNQSFLLGRFAVWNKLNFEVHTNILYRVPTCDICGSSSTIIYPFN